MIAVRQAWGGVATHFPTRIMEWFMVAMLAIWGLGLVVTPEIFDLPAYAILARMFTAPVWGGMCLTFCLLRFVALFVNGTFTGTWYSRYSPLVRAVFSFLSCAIWLTIALSFYASGTIGLATYIYLLVLAAEVWCSARGFIDADRVLRNVTA